MTARLTLLCSLCSRLHASVAVDGACSPETVTSEYSISDADIDTVTVFSDRAEIMRVLPLRPGIYGRTDIILAGLPGDVDPDSVRVNVVGSGVEILDISQEKMSEKYEEGAKRRRDQEGEDEEDDEVRRIEELSEQLQILEMSSTRLAAEKKLLETFAETQLRMHSRLEADRAAGILDVYRVRMSAYQKEEHQISISARHATKEKLKIERTLQQRADTFTDTRAITVAVVIGGSCQTSLVKSSNDPSNSIKVIFRYVVEGAGWSPSYDVLVGKDGGSDVQLNYYGVLWQNTREEWRAVKLRLSTASPALGLRPPKVPRRVIHFQSSARHRAPEDEVKPGSLSSTFGVELPATVAANGRPHRVMVAQVLLDAEFKHYATPTVSAHAYLVASMNNTGRQHLLSSKCIRVFFDGEFVSTSELADPVAAGRNFSVFLGVDPAVKVIAYPEVENKQRSWSETLGVSNEQQVTHECRWSITNEKDSQLRMILKDGLVRSQTSQIKVELLRPESQPHGTDLELDLRELLEGENRLQFDEQTGEMTWAACVAPRSSSDIQYTYTITAPRDSSLETFAEGTFRPSRHAHMEL